MPMPGPAAAGTLPWNISALMAGFDAVQVPYRGNAPLVIDLVAGQVKAGFVASAGVIPHVREGRLRGLAISSAKRSPLAPEVPTTAEAGYPDLKLNTYFVLLAPAKTPDPVIVLIEREIKSALQSADLQEKFRAHDIEAARYHAGRSQGAAASGNRIVGRYRQGKGQSDARPNRKGEIDAAEFPVPDHRPASLRLSRLLRPSRPEDPHIDSIAPRGTRFTRFYVATPVCMPNRATLMTGRMPSVHGVRSNGSPLSLQSNTFVDALRAAGYATALVGKSHLQNFTEFPPILRRRRRGRAIMCSMPTSPKRASRVRPTAPMIRSIPRAGRTAASSR